MKLMMGVLVGVLWWSVSGNAWPPTFRLELPLTPGSVEQPRDMLQRVITILEQEGARRSARMHRTWHTDFYRTAEGVDVGASLNPGPQGDAEEPPVWLLCMDPNGQADGGRAEEVCRRIARAYMSPDL